MLYPKSYKNLLRCLISLYCHNTYSLIPKDYDYRYDDVLL